MGSKRRSPSPRFRVGKVSVYLHHGAWWVYYRDNGKPVRSKVAQKHDDAERIAAQINAQVTNGSPTLLSFEPISVADLRQQFLDYHEHVLNSSLSTVRRSEIGGRPRRTSGRRSTEVSGRPVARIPQTAAISSGLGHAVRQIHRQPLITGPISRSARRPSPPRCGSMDGGVSQPDFTLNRGSSDGQGQQRAGQGEEEAEEGGEAGSREGGRVAEEEVTADAVACRCRGGVAVNSSG